MDLRQTFDHQAVLYRKARPSYPAPLFNTLIRITGIKPEDKLLEIGPGTGQATLPLAKKGFRITGVELGKHLAMHARHELHHYADVKIITSAFEGVNLPLHTFNLIYSATAFHWIDPKIKFTKAHQLLVPHGHLAIIHTHHVSDGEGDDFHKISQPIYDRYWPPEVNPPHLPQLADLKPPAFDLALFKPVYFEVFPLTIRYTAAQYADLLATYSPTLALSPARRSAFLKDIKLLITKNFEGIHDKHFAMSLAIASKQ